MQERKDRTKYLYNGCSIRNKGDTRKYTKNEDRTTCEIETTCIGTLLSKSLKTTDR